jgi:hypothetical protein
MSAEETRCKNDLKPFSYTKGYLNNTCQSVICSITYKNTIHDILTILFFVDRTGIFKEISRILENQLV